MRDSSIHKAGYETKRVNISAISAPFHYHHRNESGLGCGEGYAPATAEVHDKSVVVVSDPGCPHQTLAKGRLYEMKHR
jgi:hypothetical protein